MALSTNFTQRVPETTKFSKITQNKGEDGAVLKNRKITISRPRLERFRQNLVQLRS